LSIVLRLYRLRHEIDSERITELKG